MSGYYPVVVITGPRQSGKTTLCQAAFPQKAYVNLEAVDVRERVVQDPRGFLAEHVEGAIIDEVQYAPELLSYLQVDVDRQPEPGRFILTGSQHFGLSERIAQSLAGRVGVLTLLPPSLDELRRFPSSPSSLWEVLWQGAYPRIHDRGIPAQRWLSDYVSTYVQRDVRQVLNVTRLEAFTTFIKLAAARTAQVLNLSSLGGDVGVSHNTARSWLSVLETSYLAFHLHPWHQSIKKQLIKAPKLHFFDSGLVCYLLGIRSPEELRHHPLRGAIFESWVVSEVYKARVHSGLEPDLYYFRDSKGLEVDLLRESPAAITLVEAKSGATVGSDFFAPQQRLTRALKRAVIPQPVRQVVVFGGDDAQQRSVGEVLPWAKVSARDWTE